MESFLKPRAKVLSLDNDDLWVEARIKGVEGVSDADPVSFPLSSVAEIAGFGDSHSVLRLQSGRELFFSLTHAELRKKLQTAEGESIDLRVASVPLTANELCHQLAETLRRKFEVASRPEEEGAPLTNDKIVESLTFTAWARGPNKDNFKQITFSGSDIVPSRISENESAMGGRNLSFHLRRPLGSAFPKGEFIVEISMREFRNLCDEAYMGLQTAVDMSEISLSKGRTLPPKPAAPPPPAAPAP